MTNTEIVWRALAKLGPCLRAALMAPTGLSSDAVSNALENLLDCQMVERDGRRWSVAKGRTWRDHPRPVKHPPPSRRKDGRPPAPPRDTLHDAQWDFRPLYDAMGMP